MPALVYTASPSFFCPARARYDLPISLLPSPPVQPWCRALLELGSGLTCLAEKYMRGACVCKHACARARESHE